MSYAAAGSIRRSGRRPRCSSSPARPTARGPATSIRPRSALLVGWLLATTRLYRRKTVRRPACVQARRIRRQACVQARTLRPALAPCAGRGLCPRTPIAPKASRSALSPTSTTSARRGSTWPTSGSTQPSSPPTAGTRASPTREPRSQEALLSWSDCLSYRGDPNLSPEKRQLDPSYLAGGVYVRSTPPLCFFLPKGRVPLLPEIGHTPSNHGGSTDGKDR